MATSPEGNTCNNGRLLGVFQTVGVPTDEGQFFVLDPTNLTFYFYPADGDMAEMS